MRIREDKLYPNGFNTCLTNFENRLNPIEDFKNFGYFEINNHDSKYTDFRELGNDFRKETLKKSLNYTNKKNLVIFDFGSGRGVNLHMILPISKMYISLEPDRMVWVE